MSPAFPRPLVGSSLRTKKPKHAAYLQRCWKSFPCLVWLQVTIFCFKYLVCLQWATLSRLLNIPVETCLIISRASWCYTTLTKVTAVTIFSRVDDGYGAQGSFSFIVVDTNFHFKRRERHNAFVPINIFACFHRSHHCFCPAGWAKRAKHNDVAKTFPIL